MGNIIVMRFDLHVHSSFSPCSVLSLPEILGHARSKGLDGVCITDHDSMDAGETIREGIQQDGLCIIIGMEYMTPQGHFLIFGPFEGLPPGMDAESLLSFVRSARGAAVAAHPFRSCAPTMERFVREGFCNIVEQVNGRNSDQENDRVKAWTERYDLTQVGGSDAHTLSELGRITTRFSTPIRSRQDLVEALMAGRCGPDPLSRR